MIVTHERRYSFLMGAWYDAPVYEYEVGDRVLIHGHGHTVTGVIEKRHGGFHGVGRYEVRSDGGRTGTVTGYFATPMVFEEKVA